jgi:tetratricopeptide (TPR) repeat protein
MIARGSIGNLFSLSLSLSLFACSSETLRRQEQLIQQQEAEIHKQRQEIEELEAAERKEAERRRRRRDCNRAFLLFERAQGAAEAREVVALYREGLDLCPDDEVAHYEAGKVLAGMGRTEEAAREFEAALRINPNFQDARRQLQAMGK